MLNKKASTVLLCQTGVMGRRIYILLGMFVHCVYNVSCGRKNEWSTSKGDPDPKNMWGLSYQNHDSLYDSGKTYAELHNVKLVTGNNTFGYLSLDGSAETYVYINNSDLAFSNGGYAFSWMMYVEPAEDNDRVTLLKYETVSGSPQLHWELLEDKTMQCTIKFDDCTIMTVNSIMKVVGKMFIGINFNFLWGEHFDFFSVDNKQQKVEEKLLPSTSQIILQLQEAVHVYIGNGFKGNISCIQFYNSSMIGNPQKNAPLLCDQNLAYDKSYGDHTISTKNDHAFSVTATPTTCLSPTTDQTTPITAGRTMSFTTKSSIKVPVIQNKTTGREYVLDNCIRFKKISNNTQIANLEQTLLVRDTGTCAQMCWDLEFCYIFSVKIKPGFHLLECSLSDNNFSPEASLFSVGLFTIY